MKFLGMKKVRDGKYLKNYELSYENKAGRLKTYEIVSRKELEDVQDLGRRASGVSIVAFQDGKMLLLREFRMSINKTIFNLCAGMQEKGETIEECIRRAFGEKNAEDPAALLFCSRFFRYENLYRLCRGRREFFRPYV